LITVLALRIVISLLALALLGGHLVWPHLTIDAVSLGLIIVALLPWASTLIESAKLPGGWEIKFRDLKSASDKIESETKSPVEIERAKVASAVEVVDLKEWERFIRPIVETDANLALVALRIEIEKRLRLLAARLGMNESASLTSLFRKIYLRKELPEELFSALEDIIESGNRAAHGASVEPRVQQWALESGPRILAGLDRLLTTREG